MMRHPTLFALLLVTLLARGASPNSCAVSSEGDVVLLGTCTSAKLTLFSETDKIIIDFEFKGTGSGEPDAWSLNLKIGGCAAIGELNVGSAGNTLKFLESGKAIDLPATATVTKDKIKFVGNPNGPNKPSSFSPKCSPVFKKVDGGVTIDVESTLNKVAAVLKIIFKKVRDYSKVAKEGGWPTWAWVSIGVGGVILGLGVLITILFFGYRRWKERQLNRVQQNEAAVKKPAEKKPVEKKQESKKKSDEKPKPKTVIKQVDEVKPKTPKTSEQSVRSETSFSSRLFST